MNLEALKRRPILGILTLLFLLSAANSFFRYTDIYRLFIPKWITGATLPPQLKKQWYFNEIKETLPPKISAIGIFSRKGSTIRDHAQLGLYPIRLIPNDDTTPWVLLFKDSGHDPQALIDKGFEAKLDHPQYLLLMWGMK